MIDMRRIYERQTMILREYAIINGFSSKTMDDREVNKLFSMIRKYIDETWNNNTPCLLECAKYGLYEEFVKKIDNKDFDELIVPLRLDDNGYSIEETGDKEIVKILEAVISIQTRFDFPAPIYNQVTICHHGRRSRS